MTKFNERRLMAIIRAPIISEKATLLADRRDQIIFEVEPSATKPEIKQAVEFLFKVQVKSVNVSNVKGKEKRFGRYVGSRSGWRKAFVRLREGQEITFAEA